MAKTEGFTAAHMGSRNPEVMNVYWERAVAIVVDTAPGRADRDLLIFEVSSARRAIKSWNDSLHQDGASLDGAKDAAYIAVWTEKARKADARVQQLITDIAQQLATHDAFASRAGILPWSERRQRLVDLKRNFGHQTIEFRAIAAGILEIERQQAAERLRGPSDSPTNEEERPAFDGGYPFPPFASNSHDDIFKMFSRETLLASAGDATDAPVQYISARETATEASKRRAELGAAKSEIAAAWKSLAGGAHAQIGTIARGAFSAYTDAITNAMATGRFSAGAFGKAMESVASNSLKSIGSQAAVKGAFEIAEGIKDLASHRAGASEHFAASGEFFAVAALAGAAAGATSPKSSSSPDNKQQSVAPRSGAANGQVLQRITYIGASLSPERLAQIKSHAASQIPS